MTIYVDDMIVKLEIVDPIPTQLNWHIFPTPVCWTTALGGRKEVSGIYAESFIIRKIQNINWKLSM